MSALSRNHGLGTHSAQNPAGGEHRNQPNKEQHMKKRYRVVVTTVTRQEYEIGADNVDEVRSLWNYDPYMFRVIGKPTTQEFIAEVPVEVQEGE